jgi:hypothetical protein
MQGGVVTFLALSAALFCVISAQESSAPDAKFLKIERMRRDKWDASRTPSASQAASVSAAPAHNNPTAEVAAFKEQARKRMAARLTLLFDHTRDERLARERARRIVGERTAQKRLESGLKG